MATCGPEPRSRGVAHADISPYLDRPHERERTGGDLEMAVVRRHCCDDGRAPRGLSPGGLGLGADRLDASGDAPGPRRIVQRPTAVSPAAGMADVGDIAVIEDDGFIVIPENEFDLRGVPSLLFTPAGTGSYAISRERIDFH